MPDDMPRVVSIDPPGARDLDDAVAATRLPDGSWRVDVWIPNVPALLERGSQADATARARGLTTYSAEAIRTPMLPRDLVDRLSLSADRDVPVIQVSIDVAADLQPRVSGVRRTHARTLAAMTYQQADAAIAAASHPLHGALAPLWDLAIRLHEERAAATGAVFDLDLGLATDEEGRTVRLGEGRANRGNLVVMEMMILANSALAAHARETGAAVLYRNHRLRGMARGDRRSAAMQIARDEGVGRTVAAARLRTMSHLVDQAEMGVESLGHHGLDREDYAWFTSPLRRYADVINLRALLDGVVEDDAAALASRLTGVHRQQKSSSDEHHGATARREIMRWLAAGDHDRLDGRDVHTIVRAMTENPGFDRQHAYRHIARRMAGDELSGRDIAALVDHAEQLLGREASETIASWVGGGPRAVLLREHRDGAQETAAERGDGVNHKGALLEHASSRGARVTFAPPTRTGPPHAPVFTVGATWADARTTVEASAQGRTLRMAEHAASKALLEKVHADTDGIAPPPIATTPATTAAGAPPKTALLELAAATPGGGVDFGEPRRTGPDHAPRFEVEVAVTLRGTTIHAAGHGGSRREAERNASVEALRMIAGQ